MRAEDPILRVRDLTVDYRSPLRHDRAVNGLSFDVHRGEAVSLVGESGCGKSTTALSILRLLPAETRITGQIQFEGRDLASLSEREISSVRGRDIGMIFQEPLSALNPVYRIGWQIAEVIRRHLRISAGEARKRVLELLDQVALPSARQRIDAFPHELSGGQRQRVMIAMAVALRPRLLIADEPTTALDASVRHQILALINELRRDMDMSLLVISHDIPLVSHSTDRVVVLHHGEEMEHVRSATIFNEAQHPYTCGLIDASLRLGDGRHYSRDTLSEIETLQKDGNWTFTVRKPAVVALPASPPAEIAVNPPPAALTVEDLCIDYPVPGGKLRAVDRVSFAIERGASLGLVGESGCGKSSLSRAIVGLVRPSAGRILLGQDRIDGLTSTRLRPFRRRVQMVFQDPFASLNPRQDVQTALSMLLAANGIGSAQERERRVREALDQVALPLAALGRRPHEFSGGQRQRIAIARALILRPELIICDEPVSALDVSVQAQILNLLARLKRELGLTYLFISHDLAVVEFISDDVMVMRKGRILERAPAENIWRAPQHEYTRQLVRAAGLGVQGALQSEFTMEV